MTEEKPIYLDYAATTPVDSRVIAAMMPVFEKYFGNPSSKDHQYGNKARELVEAARDQVANIVFAEPASIVFTSGGTESNNLAIRGVMERAAGNHLVVSAIEHASVLDTAMKLERQGIHVTYVPPTPDGRIDPDAIASSIEEETALVSVMWANNELGTLSEIETIASLCRSRGVLMHSDAAQAVGKIPVDATLVDLLTCTGHKLYAPKGIGALVVGRGVELSPQILGGGSERGRRAGTMNAASIVGFGKACELCSVKEHATLSALRDQLEYEIMENVSGAHINGCTTHRLPNISSIRFDGLGPDFVPSAIVGVACSAGSACGSGEAVKSHVLQAVGLSQSESASTLRLSLGRMTTIQEVKNAANAIVSCVRQCTCDI